MTIKSNQSLGFESSNRLCSPTGAVQHVAFQEQILHFVDIFAFGFWHQEPDEQRPDPADDPEDDERDPRAPSAGHVLELIGHGEGEDPVERCRDGAGHSFVLGGEDLAHHDPGDGAQSDGEDHDEDGEGDQREDAQVGQVVGLLQVEVDAEADQADAHDERRDEEEDLATRSVDQEGRQQRRYQLEQRVECKTRKLSR